MSSHSNRRRIVLLAGLLVLGIAALIVLVPRWSASGVVRVPPPLEPASREESVPATTASDADRAPAPQVPASTDDRNAHGSVVDDRFGTPLLALVVPDTGPRVLTSAETGAFELGAAAAGSAQLCVSAPHFEDARVEADRARTTEGLVVRLHAKSTAAVVVTFQGGAPAAGAQVEWRAATGRIEIDDTDGWFDPRKSARGAPISMQTDANGVARIDAGLPLLAIVRDPRRQAALSVRVLPGEERIVVLPDAAVQLHVVDFGTREPIAGLELESWLAREAESFAEPLVTDANGDVAIEAPSFPICIRRRGAEAFQWALVALSPGAVPCGLAGDRKTMLRLDAAPPPGPLLVGVRACGGRVLLVDAASGKPIDAPVRVSIWNATDCRDDETPKQDGCSKRSPRCRSQNLDVLRSRAGVLALPDWLYAANGADDGKLVARELLFVVAGYHPVHTSITTERGTPDESLPVVRLPAAPQRTLHVLHQDGTPFTRPVEVFSPHENTLVWSSSGACDGVHGPIDWLGGDWIVNRESKVSVSELGGAEEVTLRVPDETGVIVLEGIPAGCNAADLLAVGPRAEEKVEFHPSRFETDACRFEGLPAGSFVVGPASWVRVADWQSYRYEILGESGTPRPMRTQLAPGATVVLHWQSYWSAGRTIEGHVRVVGPGQVEPLLFSFYVPFGAAAKEAPDLVPHMILDRRSPRLPLDRDGRYRIAADEPVPWMIAVCVASPGWGSWADNNGLCVIDTILTGESAEIATAALELSWKGSPPAEPVWVTYDMPAESLRHPLSTAFQTARVRWNAVAPLRLNGVPLRTGVLHVQDRILPLKLTAGGVTRIEVDLEKLERISRPTKPR